MKSSLDGISLNGVPLATVIEDIPPDPADDYQKTKDKVFCYRRPVTGAPKAKPGPEKRRGKVKHLQKEINMSNRIKLIRDGGDDHGVLGKVVAVLLTSEEALTMEEICEVLNFETGSKNGYRARYYLGRIKQSELAPYMRFTERSAKGKATYGMLEDGFNLTLEDAIAFAKINHITRKKSKPATKPIEEVDLEQKIREEITKKKEIPGVESLDCRGATFNLDLGEIHVHFHININLPH